MAYATLETFKAYLSIPAAEVTDDTLLRDLLERASKAIDNHCGRRFSANTETHYFEADMLSDTNTLHMDDDLLSVTTLTNGDDAGTTILPTEYWLIPRNDSPKFAIRLKSDSTYRWEWDTDGWVSVLGTWGWSTTPPDDIVQACIRLAAYYYHQKDVPVYETTVFPDSGYVSVPVGMPVDVKEILSAYKVRGGR